jgi:TolA-binding protein
MDATLHLILDQFKELKSEISTITAELKTDMCALFTGQEALKSDIGNIIEDKVGNHMSTVTEGLKTEMNDLRREVSELESRINEGQAEVEEKFERQQKQVTSIVEQQIRHLREGIEATRRKLEVQLAAVDAQSRCVGGGSPGANSTTVKPPKFDGATSWAMFHRQFEAVAVQNN